MSGKPDLAIRSDVVATKRIGSPDNASSSMDLKARRLELNPDATSLRNSPSGQVSRSIFSCVSREVFCLALETLA